MHFNVPRRDGRDRVMATKQGKSRVHNHKDITEEQTEGKEETA
jgi:hypothetical protein